MIALLEAANKSAFPPEVPFAAFAGVRIRGQMLNFVRDELHTRDGAAPFKLGRKARALMQQVDDVEQDLGRHAAMDELRAAMPGVSTTRIAAAARAVHTTVARDGRVLGNVAPAYACQPHEDLDAERVLSRLPPDYARALCLSYGLGNVRVYARQEAPRRRRGPRRVKPELLTLATSSLGRVRRAAIIRARADPPLVSVARELLEAASL